MGKAQVVLPIKGWYNRLLNVGNRDGYPMFTFTGSAAHAEEEPRTKPSDEYLGTIALGLAETFSQRTEDNISKYLRKAEGLISCDESKLRKVISGACGALRARRAATTDMRLKMHFVIAQGRIDGLRNYTDKLEQMIAKETKQFLAGIDTVKALVEPEHTDEYAIRMAQGGIRAAWENIPSDIP